MKWFVCAAWLVGSGMLYADELDPRLIGVWLDEPGKNRIEISTDGHLTLWSSVHKRQRGRGAELKFENRRKLDMVGAGRLSVPMLGPLVANPRNGTASFWHSKNRTGTFLRLDENGKLRVTKRNVEDVPLSTEAITFAYNVEERAGRSVLTLTTEGQLPSVIRYERLRFDTEVNGVQNGPRALHDHQVFYAELVHTLDQQAPERFADLLESPGGDFLRDEAMLENETTAAMQIRRSIYAQILRRNDVLALKALIGSTGLRPQPEHISSQASDEMKAFLWEILNIDPNALSRKELGLQARLLNQRYFLGPSLQFKRLYSRHGCERAHETHLQNRAMRVETPEERVEQEAENAARHTDAGFYFRINEEAFRLCLRNFDKGEPIPKRILSESTIPGLSVDDHGITNPLYFFADPMMMQPSGSRREGAFNPYTYTVMKVLLDNGADPALKPTPEHPPLAEFMYQKAPHDQFKRALQQQSKYPNRAAKNFDVQRTLHHIKAYNDVMHRIHGTPYAIVETTAPAGIPSASGSSGATPTESRTVPLPLADSPGMLSLINPGFEAPRVAQYQFGIDSWQGTRHGVVVPPSNMFPQGMAPEGRQLGFLSRPGSWMSQALALQPAPNWRYTVQVFAGVRLESGFDVGHIVLALRVGELVVATQQFPTPAKGEFAAMTLTYDAPDKPPQGALTVVLQNVDTRQVNVDLVRLFGYSRASGIEPPELNWENRHHATQSAAEDVRGQPPTRDARVQAETAHPVWETVGFWNFDRLDGQAIPGGLTLISKPGSGLGKNWSNHLELKAHNQLRERQRTLWPVELSRVERKVCVNYPDYPSYSAHLDLPGEADDGVYVIGPCQ